MNEPATSVPVCTVIGGCVGTTWCDYCGQPRPVSHDARRRLRALVDVLRESLQHRPAA